ncbi:MAG: cyclic nucleotide-binding domain-containing protein [Terriglobales bacterium]
MSFDPNKADIPGDAAQALTQALDSFGTGQTCSPGTVLFRQGHPGHGVLVLRRGNVELYVSTEDRRTRLPYRTVGPGSVLGLPALFSGEPFSLTAEALEECEFSFVQRETALQLMRDRLDLCLQAVIQMASEITALGQWRVATMYPHSHPPRAFCAEETPPTRSGGKSG